MSASQTQPLIVGLSCRVPGARGLPAMWDVLASGRCTVGTVDDRLFDPAQYFDPHRTRRGKSYTFAAGQLEGLWKFDANFFGISPRVATEMDPQQCLMLQSVWEAVEDAGLNIRDLAGDRTGVFVGASLVEVLPKYYLDPARGGSSFPLGNTLSVIANRVSSVFDFGGPSYVLDTACSSGLYALHQARDAIASGEIDTAVVGGVHVVRTPGGFVGFSQARMLSPTGLCKAFDASADGYVRSEACVTIILMKPEKAAVLGPKVRGRVLATGVNSDGATQQLTVPSAVRQDKVLSEVLARSGKDPEEIDFYEAHGTGTQVGDLAEASGLGDAIGTLRRQPLLIGSAKTNFGHSEPASGLVGVAKALLAIEHRTLPASLHFTSPNPAIDFDSLNLKVADHKVDLPDSAKLIAGISSFGFGGTNVVAMIESLDPSPKTLHPNAAMTKTPWLRVSAESEVSLDRLCTLWADKLDTTEPSEWSNIVSSAARRAALTYRTALPLSRDAPHILRRGSLDLSIKGKVSDNTALSVFAFPGNGAQHPTMGRAAYAANKTYRTWFDNVADAFSSVGLAGLRDHLVADDLETQLHSPMVAQPLLFACQVAQVHAMKAANIVPEAVIGHSLGEIAALHIAGAFDLEDAAKIIVRRSARFEKLRGQGGMLAVGASETDVRQVLSGFHDSLGIAAINSPNSVTIAGPNAMLERFAKATLRGKRLAMVRLGVEVPYHSGALDPLVDDFHDDMADITFRPLTLPVAGSTVGRMLQKTDVDAQYLWHNARNPVRFQDAIQALAKEQPCICVEIAPKTVLAPSIRDTARVSGISAAHHFPSQPDEDDARLAAECWVHGIPIVTTDQYAKTPPAKFSLPTYPWDEQEYFPPLSPDGFDGWGELSTHGLAGRRINRDAANWIGDFTHTQPAWVADHEIGGAVTLPATALMEIILSAGAALWPDAAIELTEFDIVRPAEIGAEGLRIHTTIDVPTGATTLAMRSRLSDAGWVTLARANLRRTSDKVEGSKLPSLSWQTLKDSFYKDLSAAGLSYGPNFRTLDAIAPRGKARIFCRLRSFRSPSEFCLDPLRLDGAFHGLAALGVGSNSELAHALKAGAILIPNRAGKVVWNGTKTPACYARLDITTLRSRSLAIDIRVFDETGQAIAKLEGVEFTLFQPPQSKGMDPKFWRRKLPRWRAPHAPVKWPYGWQTPEKTLKKLGLTQQLAKVPRADLLAEVRTALSDNTDVTSALRGVLDQAPNLANDARALVANHAGASDYAVAQNTASQRAMWQIAERLVAKLRTSWRDRERFNLCVLGLINPVIVQNWTEATEIDEVILSAADPQQFDYLSVALRDTLLPRLRSNIGSGQADLILALGDTAQALDFESFAAPNAMVLRIETVPSQAYQPDPKDWFATVGDFRVRVRLEAAGRAQPVPITHLSKAQKDVWPTQALNSLSDPNGRATIVHVHPKGETASASLARLLNRLKALNIAATRPSILLVWNEGGANFGALASAAGSLVRSVRNEDPDWKLSAIVIDAAPPETLWNAILDAATREPVLYVCNKDIRVERIDAAARERATGPNLTLKRPVGTERRLRWHASRRPKPRAGEVEIDVAATGLNFRDVLWAQGRIPDRLFDLGASPPSMGMECAGVISRVGVGTNLTVGQAVMTFAPAAFRRYVVMEDAAILPVPEGFTLQQAAALPVAFATAWDSLHRVARLSKGETVLIHGAAGGVGMAAVQIARAIDARVFATAGTPEKRLLVQSMGAEAVFDSRNLSFADAVVQATDGRGVDVVLNNLAGAAMERSVACLAPFGRFVELGKRDILEGTRLNLQPFLKNCSYLAYDLDQRLAADPDGVRATIYALLKDFAQGKLKPLPVTQYDADAIDEAVQDMQAARQVGKIVVTPPGTQPRPKTNGIKGTWVILGGTGGVGLALAGALLQAGAGHIHLVSRSGTLPLGSGPEGDWAKQDPRVSLQAVDARDPDALEKVFADIGPISGVIHAAMTLRDRLLRDLDTLEMRQVIGSKLAVAESLDLVLRRTNMRPAHVLFLSSVAAFLGNPGQIAYAAANAGLEAIAAHRRSDGLAGSVLALGPIKDRGALAQDPAKLLSIARLDGIDFLTIGQCIDAVLDALRRPSCDDQLYARLDLRDMARTLPTLADRTFDRLVTNTARNQKTAQDLTAALRTENRAAALKLAQSELNDALCNILKLPADQFDPRRPLSRYGIDSLMAMELRLEVERRFNIGLPVSALTESATTFDMANTILQNIREHDT
ncbi:MAG: type I polyketide synthase [Paracoccaceae bacterium]